MYIRYRDTFSYTHIYIASPRYPPFFLNISWLFLLISNPLITNQALKMYCQVDSISFLPGLYVWSFKSLLHIPIKIFYPIYLKSLGGSPQPHGEFMLLTLIPRFIQTDLLTTGFLLLFVIPDCSDGVLFTCCFSVSLFLSSRLLLCLEFFSQTRISLPS